MRVFRINGVLQRENASFSHKCGILEGKSVIFWLSGGFANRKRVIFASKGDLRRENT